MPPEGGSLGTSLSVPHLDQVAVAAARRSRPFAMCEGEAALQVPGKSMEAKISGNSYMKTIKERLLGRTCTAKIDVPSYGRLTSNA